MHYWRSSRWSFLSNSEDNERWIELPLPFALIGSHPRCQVRVDYKRLPSVVYFAVVCGSKIEIWPLCGIAFPVWGRVKSDTRILVGKSRLKLIGENDPAWAFSAGKEGRLPGDAINDIGPLSVEAEPAGGSLILDWGAGTQTRKLRRRVSVLGEGHPSVIRLHGLGLRECELGIICTGKRIWVVQLNPEAVPAGQSLVRELVTGQESVWVGSVHLWANEQGAYSTKRFGSLGQTGTQTESPDSIPSADNVAAEQNGLMVDGYSAGAAGQRATLGRTPGGDADSVAMQFTDRLLKKTGRRANRENLIKWVATGSLLLAAVSVVGFVVMRGVLPIFHSIYSE
jgi:hypothetical protein